MAGRRIHERLRVASPRAAVVRVSRDVWFQQTLTGDLTVISRTPAYVNERLTLTLASKAGTVDLNVEVVDSVPVVIDGSVRHRLTLRRRSRNGGAYDER